MASSIEVTSGVAYAWDVTENYQPGMDNNLMLLAHSQGTKWLVSASVTSPPVSPVDGQGYIIPAGATGDWYGRTNLTAFWNSRYSIWVYHAPAYGQAFFIVDVGYWVEYRPPGSWIVSAVKREMIIRPSEMSRINGAALGVFNSGIYNEPVILMNDNQTTNPGGSFSFLLPSDYIPALGLGFRACYYTSATVVGQTPAFAFSGYIVASGGQAPTVPSSVNVVGPALASSSPKAWVTSKASLIPATTNPMTLSVFVGDVKRLPADASDTMTGAVIRLSMVKVTYYTAT